MSLADAAVDWEGVTPAEYELIVIGEDGLPDLPDRPDLRERAEAILTAAQSGRISGWVTDEDGFPRRPHQMRLERDSVAAWIKETDSWLAGKETAAVAEPSSQLNVPMQPQMEPKLITAAQVREMLALPLSTFKTHRRLGLIPAPVSSKPLRWDVIDIINHIAARKAAQKEKEDAKKAAKQAKEEEIQQQREAEAAKKKQGKAAMEELTASATGKESPAASFVHKMR